MTVAKKTYFCMGKMHLSQNFVSFEVYYIVELFLLQGRHGSESTSDETLKAKSKNRTKAR